MNLSSTVSSLLILALLLAGFGASRTFAADATIPPPNPLAKAKSHYARLGTNSVHYVTLGNANQAVVFVHGWGGNVAFWKFQVPALMDRVRLILVDLPGHGKSNKPHAAYTMDFFAEAVEAVMRDAKVGKATLVGHSMGTPVICRFHKNYPEKVAALVAADGALRPLDVKPDQIEAFIGKFRASDYRKRAAEFIGGMFPHPGTEGLRDRAIADVLKTPQHVMVSAMEGMWRDQTTWAPGKIDVPLLVVNAKSPFWTADYEAHVRKIAPNVDYRTIEGTGHFLMLEKPAEFNTVLVDFLQKNGLTGK